MLRASALGCSSEVLDLVVGDGHIRIYFVVGAPGTHKTTKSTVGERRGKIRAFDAVTLAGLGHDGRVVFAVGVNVHGFPSIRAIPPVWLVSRYPLRFRLLRISCGGVSSVTSETL